MSNLSDRNLTNEDVKDVAEKVESDELNEEDMEAIAGGRSGLLGIAHDAWDFAGDIIGDW